jgi:hypothetical protein
MTTIPEMVPILITGAHRSGTTWVGKVLAGDPHIAYISEPLHRNHSRGVFDQSIDFWYQYICDDNGDQFHSAYQKTIRFDFQIRAGLKDVKNLKAAGKLLINQISFIGHSLQGRRILFKDPFAVVSVPWFIQRLNAQVIIMVRHPLSFISSLQRLQWQFDFEDLLQQPLLMRDHLEPFREEMIQTNRNKEDIIAQGILLWRMIYFIVDQYRVQKRNIKIVRHEDISITPERIFSEICDYLGVEYSESIKGTVRRSSQAGNPAEVSEDDEHAVYLDSRANLRNWRKRLNESDINRIIAGTRDIADLFYTPGEWKEW